MTIPIASGVRLLPSSPPTDNAREPGRMRRAPLDKMAWGDSALAAPTSPKLRAPQVDMAKADPRDVEAARGMEAMFLDYVMNAMRKTVPESEAGLHNSGTRLYQSMLDSEMAQKAAKQGGIGLAEQIVAYLQSQRYNSRREHAVPVRPSTDRAVVSTGGTHESRTIK